MSNPKLRRTLYIGLGGTGIKIVKEVKKNFLNSSSNSLPSMVKFLCIDTNKGDLEEKNYEGPEKLTALEKLHLSVSDPQATLIDGGTIYDWIPKSNRDSVIDIEGTGAGQVRSNGRFILEDSEIKHHAFSYRLDQLYDQLISITNNDPNYDLLPATNIDVHLIFSIAGGTGSGMFLSVANIIRRHIPKANLMAYAFAPSFFTSVGVNWNITHNAYGALIELDYYMHGGKGKYTNVARNITKKLFDSVMYIDRNTWTKDHSEDAYSYDFDEVKVIVGHALYLSAGEIGSNTLSIVDNLRTAMNSGGYDIDCPNNGVKGAWVSSIGVSEIYCNPKADIEYKTIESALNILNNLLHGERKGLAVAETNKWIVSLNLDESDGDKDGNYLIDRMLSPDAFRTLKSQGKILVTDTGDYDDSDFIKINDTDILAKKEKPGVVIEEKRKIIINKIKNDLFPTTGSGTIGVDKLIIAVSGLKSDILNSKIVLQSEISDHKKELEKIDETIKSKVTDITEEMKRNRIMRSRDAIEEAKDSIRKQRACAYKLLLEISRREAAIKVYDELNEFLDTYVHENTGILSRLQKNIESAIEELNNNAKNNFRQKTISRESTSIDLSSRADKLSTSITETNPVKDWNNFFDYIGMPSVFDLSSKADWDTTAINYFNSKQDYTSSGPIIIRVMDTYTKQERIQKYKDLINRARPLMEVTPFGKKINPSEFIFVSYPYNISSNENERELKMATFAEEFEEALGSNKFEIIPQKDNNKILVYRQMGVIPPFYINGISYRKNGITNPESCEALYLNYINVAGERRKVKPFTDTYFEKAFENDGHTLDSEYRGPSRTKIDLWVDCFILGLIERKGELYRIQYDNGERDMSSLPFRSWMNFGQNRHEAYKVFEKAGSDFIEDLAKKIDEIIKEGNNATIREKYFGGGEMKETMYFEKALIAIDSEEFKIAEVQNQLQKELDYLKMRQ